MNVTVIGAGGYWGSKLVERFVQLITPENVEIADSEPHKVARLRQETGILRSATDYHTFLAQGMPKVDACVIATPSSTHYKIAKQCLNAGKPVLVEKPMTLDYAQAAELVELAQSKKLTLMVDSTFLYSNAIVNLTRFFPNKEGVVILPKFDLELVWTGKRYGNTPEGILWTYGPHPVSVAIALMRSPVSRVTTYTEGSEVHLGLWFSATREAEVMLDWDVPMRRRELLISEGNRLRWVNLLSPNATNYEQVDPLTNMCKRFLHRVQQEEPFIDYDGLEVVRVLEEADKQCKSH